MNRFVHWLWPLVALFGTVAAVRLLWFQRHVSTPENDAELLFGVGCCYLVAIGFLLRYTRGWTLRSLGQVGTYAADAGLYLGLGCAGLRWRHPLTTGEVNWLRSDFAVSSAVLVIGLVLWWSATRGTRRHDPSPTPAHGEMAVGG